MLQVIGIAAWIKNVGSDEDALSGPQNVDEGEAALVSIAGTQRRRGDGVAVDSVGKPEDKR